MKKNIIKIILTIIIPFAAYYGFTVIGIFAKSKMPGDQSVPNFLEGLGVTVIAIIFLALIGACLFVCWKLASVIVEGISDRIRYYRVQRNEVEMWSDWPRSPATTTPPVDEDQAYLQRIGVEEDETEPD